MTLEGLILHEAPFLTYQRTKWATEKEQGDSKWQCSSFESIKISTKSINFCASWYYSEFFSVLQRLAAVATRMPEEKAEANVTPHIYERLFLWHAYQILQWESLRIVPETVSPGALNIDSIDHGNACSYETGPVTPISCCWVCIDPEPGISGTKLSENNWNESVFNTLIRLSRKNNPALFFRVKMSAKGYLISPRDKSRCVAAIPLRGFGAATKNLSYLTKAHRLGWFWCKRQEGIRVRDVIIAIWWWNTYG